MSPSVALVAAFALVSSITASESRPKLTTKSGNLIVETGAVDGESGSFSVKDRATDAQIHLPSDLLTLNASVVELDIRRREDQRVLADSIVETSGETMAALKDVNTTLKVSHTGIGNANAALATLAKEVEKLQDLTVALSAAHFIAVDMSTDAVREGTTATIYGRNIIAGFNSGYQVALKVKNSNTMQYQQVLQVTTSSITFKMAFGIPPSAKFTVVVKVFELGAEIEDATNGGSEFEWVTPKPVVTAVQAAKYFATSKAINETLFIVTGVFNLSTLRLDFTNSNAKATGTAKIFQEQQSNGDVHVFVSIKPPTAGGVSKFTLKVTDKIAQKSTGEISVTLMSMVVVDGWALVMKIRGSDGNAGRNQNNCERYQYDWAGWENTSPDGSQNDLTLNPANVKYTSYARVPFATVRLCSDRNRAARDATTGGASCLERTFAQPWASATEMFSECDKGRNYVSKGRNCKSPGGGVQERVQMIDMFTDQGRSCPPQLPGISSRGQDSARARWGFMANLPSQGCQPSDNQDSDGATGIGLMAQSGQCRCGAGSTPWAITPTSTNTGCAWCDNAWLWVKLE